MVRDDFPEVLKIGTQLTVIRLIGEPFVVYTKFGYQPAIECERIYAGTKHTLRLGAVTLADEIESRRRKNEGECNDLMLGLKREDESKRARYIVIDPE
jgi:hypothetical protein